MKNSDMYITSKEAAKILNVSLATLKKFIYLGKIQSLKTPGGHHRILKSDLFKPAALKAADIIVDKGISETIEEFLNLIKIRQDFLKGHGVKVAELSLKLARFLDVPGAQLYRLYVAALLHDIGLLEINADIINKKSRLTEKELEIIRTHPVTGENIAKSINQLKEVSSIIRQHHERYDGAGYPDGLKGSQICFEARIISLAEAFACMTAPDSYKTALSETEALKEIAQNRGMQFDTAMADTFLKMEKANG